jgi:hypothetical protein
MKELTQGGGRYICAFIKKVISDKIKKNEWLMKILISMLLSSPFWSYCIYRWSTCQPDFSSSRQSNKRARNTEFVREYWRRSLLKGVQFHITAWISWWGKAVKLKFYNDKETRLSISLTLWSLTAVWQLKLKKNIIVTYKNEKLKSLMMWKLKLKATQ